MWSFAVYYFFVSGKALKKILWADLRALHTALYFVCMGCTYLSADMNADDSHFIIRRRYYYYYYLKYIIIIIILKKYYYYLKDIILKCIPRIFLIDGKKWRLRRFGNLFSCLSTRYSCIFGELCKALFLGFRIKM